jgi:hypothetical protein
MKRLALVVLMLSALAVAGCGGSSGGSTDCTAGENAAEAAFIDFSTILDSDDILPCLTLVATTCDCPNGGSVTVDQANLTVTLDNCTSATDEVYTGTLTMSQDLTSISANLPQFDGCTNVTATNVVVEGGCSGSISGTCGGQTLTCTMGMSDGECVPGNCSC